MLAKGCERKIARLLSFSLDHLDAHSFASVCHFAISFFFFFECRVREVGWRVEGREGHIGSLGSFVWFTCCLLKFVLRVVCFLVGVSALFVF